MKEHIKIIDAMMESLKFSTVGRKPILPTLKVAKEAMEKQVPKEPEYSGDGYDENGNLVYDMAKCPRCGNSDFEYGINNWGCDFCPDCGQALDWRNNE